MRKAATRVATSPRARRACRSWTEVEAKATDSPEATAFNTPTTKFNVGMDFADLFVRNLLGGFTVRYVNGYNFRSGVNFGHIPTFSTFDLTLGYRIPQLNSRINLSVQNMFACRGGETKPNGFIASGRPSIYTPGQQCGFNEKHIEMLNMPQLGTMVFLGLRWDR